MIECNKRELVFFDKFFSFHVYVEEWRLKNSYNHEISSHIPRDIESYRQGEERVTILCIAACYYVFPRRKNREMFDCPGQDFTQWPSQHLSVYILLYTLQSYAEIRKCIMFVCHPQQYTQKHNKSAKHQSVISL